MNNNLLNIVKQIIAGYGEGILGDPQRLKPIFKDFAKDLPKEERVAFGRCIEQGFYTKIKMSKTAEERRRLKADLARQLQSAAGISAALSAAALDILDAAVPLPVSAFTPSAPQTQSAPVPAEGTGKSPGMVSRKSLIFGAAAGAGALAGELVSEIFRLNNFIGATFWTAILRTGAWTAFIGLGITIALNLAQSKYLKRTPPVAVLVKTAFIGVAIGIAGGAAAQILFWLTANISTPVEVLFRIICWGILGWGLGFGASYFVPNYPVKRAMLAGLLGGALGGAIFRATFIIPGINIILSRVIGVTILGLFIGLAISIIEEALREAWLTVVWGPKETTTISLGTKPVVFGSSREADVYLTQRRGQPEIPPVRAIVSVEGGRVILDDRASGARRELRNGEMADLGRVSIIANIKTK